MCSTKYLHCPPRSSARAAIKQKKSQCKMDHLERARAFFYFFVFGALQVCSKALAALVGIITCISRTVVGLVTRMRG